MATDMRRDRPSINSTRAITNASSAPSAGNCAAFTDNAAPRSRLRPGSPTRIWATLSAEARVIVDEKRTEILRIATRHGARNLRVFGSHARGDARQDSDVDLLVDMESGRSLLDLVALGQDLEDLLQRHVDVITRSSLAPALRDRILAEARPL